VVKLPPGFSIATAPLVVGRAVLPSYHTVGGKYSVNVAVSGNAVRSRCRKNAILPTAC
jgi:hypothetical protein